jgi:hypothetical protein
VNFLRPALLAPLLLLAACTTSSGSTPIPEVEEESDGAIPDATLGSAVADAVAEASASDHAAPAADANTPISVGDAGTASAGKSGVDGYSARLCMHEQSCALIDAGTTSLDDCESEFEAYYEESGANPYGGNSPLELYRADYVVALGACIAEAPCTEALATSEARCSAELLTASDAGPAKIVPTSALSALCRAFQASPCLASDSGAQDCETTLELFSDPTLEMATACFSSSSPCATVTSCFAAAFTQQ